MSFVAGRSPRFGGRCCRARSCPTIGGNAATGRRLIPGGGTSPHPLTHPPPRKQEVVINSLTQSQIRKYKYKHRYTHKSKYTNTYIRHSPSPPPLHPEVFIQYFSTPTFQHQIILSQLCLYFLTPC